MMENPMQRGEVWWVNFDPSEGMEIQKCRPAVILTVNALNRARGTVVVVPLQSRVPPLWFRFLLPGRHLSQSVTSFVQQIKDALAENLAHSPTLIWQNLQSQ